MWGNIGVSIRRGPAQPQRTYVTLFRESKLSPDSWCVDVKALLVGCSFFNPLLIICKFWPSSFRSTLHSSSRIIPETVDRGKSACHYQSKSNTLGGRMTFATPKRSLASRSTFSRLHTTIVSRTPACSKPFHVPLVYAASQ